MFKTETVCCYISGITETITNYREQLKSGKALKVSFSSGNRKIGRTLNVSLAPVVTCGGACRECGCMKYCYDMKACIQYENVRNSRARNTALVVADMNGYFEQIDEKMKRRKRNKYFRFHVGGDIPNYAYFCKMVETACKHSDFVVWTYTKRYDLVNRYVWEHGRAAIPANFHIMFSVWDPLPCVNPFDFPEFRFVPKNAEKPTGFYCPGNCDVCKENGCGCLSAQNVNDSVYVLEH